MGGQMLTTSARTRISFRKHFLAYQLKDHQMRAS